MLICRVLVPSESTGHSPSSLNGTSSSASRVLVIEESGPSIFDLDQSSSHLTEVSEQSSSTPKKTKRDVKLMCRTQIGPKFLHFFCDPEYRLYWVNLVVQGSGLKAFV